MTVLVNYQKEHEQLLKIATVYKRFSKDSYICISDIHTISKERLLKINRFDPSGEIRVSNETMDTIDYHIIKLFTK